MLPGLRQTHVSTIDCNLVRSLLCYGDNQGAVSDCAANAGTFSAVCLLTAQALYDSMNGTVPVGAVESCVSGTSVERWMPPGSANFTQPWLPACKKGAASATCQGDLWESGMIPLLPMSFRAALWDQGEADAKRMNASFYRDAWPVYNLH